MTGKPVLSDHDFGSISRAKNLPAAANTSEPVRVADHVILPALTGIYTDPQGANDVAEAAGGGVVEYAVGITQLTATLLNDSSFVVTRGRGQGAVLRGDNAVTPVFQVGPTTGATTDGSHVDNLGITRSGTPGSGSVGLQHNVFNNGRISNVASYNHGYCFAVVGPTSSVAIQQHYRDCQAYGAINAYLWIVAAAGVFWSGGEMGKNGVLEAGLPCAVKITGDSNDIRLQNTNIIPRRNTGTYPTSPTNLLSFEGYTSTTGVIHLTNVNSESILHAVKSDSGTALISDLFFNGGRIVCDGDFWSLHASTVIQGLRIKGTNISATAFTLNNVGPWCRIDAFIGCDATFVGLGSTSDLDLTGTIITGNLTISGTFRKLIYDRSEVQGTVTDTATVTNSGYKVLDKLFIGCRAALTAFGEVLAVKANALVAAFYRTSSTATDSIVEWYSDVGGTKTKRAHIQADGGLLTLGAIELGHASDTTLARIAAGRVSIESHEIATLDQAQTFTAQKTLSVAGIPIILDNTGGGSQMFVYKQAGTKRSSGGADGSFAQYVFDASDTLRMSVSQAGMLTTYGGPFQLNCANPTHYFYKADATTRNGYIQYLDASSAVFAEETGGGMLFRNSAGYKISFDLGLGLYPYNDNELTCGYAGHRWTVVYAATGTINTSDATEKKWLGALPPGVLRAAKRILAGIGHFQWLDAVARKGDAGARFHIGVTAQDVEEAFKAEGEDPNRWGLFCEDLLTEFVEITVTVDQERQKTVAASVPMVEIVSGQPVLKMVDVFQPVSEYLPLLDAGGAPVMELDIEAISAWRTANPEATELPLALQRQAVHAVPIMETVQVQQTRPEKRPVIDPATGQQKVRKGLRMDQLAMLLLAAAPPPGEGGQVAIAVDFDGASIQLTEGDRVQLTSAWIAGQGGGSIKIKLAGGQALDLRAVDITRLLEAWHAAAA